MPPTSGSNPLPAVALPADDIGYRCLVSMTNEDPDYPAAHLLDPDPAHVAKATGNTTDVTIEPLDLAGAVTTATPIAIAIINTNADNIYVDSPAIMVPVANVDADGQRVHPWRALDGLLSAASTFTIRLERVDDVQIWIGRIALVTALYPLNLRYGLRTGRNRPGDVSITTRLGSVLTYPAAIRTRWAEGETGLLEDAPLRHDLEASTQGLVLPFLFIPDENTNSAWWVRHRANDYQVEIPDLDGRLIPFRVDEVSSGPVNL